MVVSTIYDKDLKQKVFQVRGSERYTNSTQTTLEIEYDASHRSYLEVTLTSTVKRKIGSSSIVFYCDDTILGIEPCNESDSEVEATYQVSYGYHKFYAKYVGNTQCLSSKSGIVELGITEPDLEDTSITFNIDGNIDIDRWIEDIDDLVVKITLKDESNNTITNEDVSIYLNDELYDTVTLTEAQQVLSLDYTGYGSHIYLKAVFEGDDTYLECEKQFDFYHGYSLTAIPEYTKVGVGTYVNVGVSLSKTTGTPMGSKWLQLKKGNDVVGTGITDSNGNATLIAIVNAAGENNYTVVETSTEETTPSFAITAVQISDIAIESDKITSTNVTLPITLVAYDTNNATVADIPITVDNDTLVTNNYGLALYTYDGVAAGDVDMTISAGSYTETYSIEDTFQYFSQSQQKSYNLNYSVRNSLSVLQKYNGLELAASLDDGNFRLIGDYNSQLPLTTWKFEFDIVRYENYNTLTVCGVEIPYNLIGLKPHIRVERKSSSLEVYVNDTKVATKQNFQNRAEIIVGGGATLILDNLKLMRL